MSIDNKTLLIENDKIFLRPLSAEDVNDEYVSGLNDAEVNRYLVNVRQVVQTTDTVKKFIIYNAENPKSIFFGIFIKNDEKPFVGTLRVSEIDLFHYSASLGICLFAKRAWGKGYASSAINLVKEYLFNKIGLHSIEAGVYADNISSLTLFKKAGFVKSYRVKNKIRHIDSFKDVIYLSAVNSNFEDTLLLQNTNNNKQ